MLRIGRGKLPNPVGARLVSLETLEGAVTCRANPVVEGQVDFGEDAGNVEAGHWKAEKVEWMIWVREEEKMLAKGA